MNAEVVFLSRLFAVASLALLLAGQAVAQTAPEKALPVTGEMAPDGSSATLAWANAKPPRVGGVVINRRELGVKGPKTWDKIRFEPGPVMRFVDDTTRPGVAYEYQVRRFGRSLVDAGYVVVGTEVPDPEHRGSAYVIVDDTLATDLAPRLDRLDLDLVGDGWTVERRTVARHQGKDPVANLEVARGLRLWLSERVLADPFGIHTILLIGRVPMVRSGNAAPDGHDLHSHVTDLYYADTGADWPDDGQGRLMADVVPSSHIEAMIGRVDFSGVSNGDRVTELQFLRAYLDKSHAWRHGLLGDPRQAYGSDGRLFVENAALEGIVGAENLQKGGHHMVGETQQWLLGIDFGHSDGRIYPTRFRNRAHFTLNFGSHKQKIGAQHSAMTAMLAQPWYVLSVGWGGRPAWRLHDLGMGLSIGQAHMTTVNNGLRTDPYETGLDYRPTGKYIFRNTVWVNLLGDPTLRPFVLAPPSQVTAIETDAGVRLEWTRSDDGRKRSYRVYRAPIGSYDFKVVSGDEALTETTFTDPAPDGLSWYMVRAHALKDVAAGSIWRWSQGTYVLPDITSEAPENVRVSLSEDGTAPIALPKGGLAFPVRGPEPGQGRLDWADGGWVYRTPAAVAAFLSDAGVAKREDEESAPPTDPVFPIRVPYAVFDGLTTRPAEIEINGPG